MNPIFLAWLVYGQPRRKRKRRSIKVQDYATNTATISSTEGEEGEAE
jgi:hypothetical protein